MEGVLQIDFGCSSLRKRVRYNPLFIGNKLDTQACGMMKFGGNSCEVASMKSVTRIFLKTQPKLMFQGANHL